VTGADGSYRFGDVPAGTYTLEARYVGVEPELLTLTVPQVGSVRGDFALGGDNATQILVNGLGANQASALSRKRESDVVSDVLTRDAIGQFPDQNVAESLRRLPGVNTLPAQRAADYVARRAADAPQDPGTEDIPCLPARVALQHFTGVPAVVDLAAMPE